MASVNSATHTKPQRMANAGGGMSTMQISAPAR